MSFYESDELLAQYMEFHYGDTWFDVANYPRACADYCLDVLPEDRLGRALDLGCAVGRTSLELARSFDEVVAVDLSNRFIQQAQSLQRDGEAHWFRVDEGELGQHRHVSLEQLGLSEAAQRVCFHQGDATAWSDGGPFDLVFAGNLIDRLPDPGAFLRDVHRHLSEGGLLVLSSPYTLLEEFTPRSHWIGGFYVAGHRVTVLEGMGAALEPRFEPCVPPEDIPFVIRETRRKFQHSLAQITVWRRL